MKTTETIIRTRDDSAVAVITEGTNIKVEVRYYSRDDDGAVAYTRMLAVVGDLETDQLIDALIDARDRLGTKL